MLVEVENWIIFFRFWFALTAKVVYESAKIAYIYGGELDFENEIEQRVRRKGDRK